MSVTANSRMKHIVDVEVEFLHHALDIFSYELRRQLNEAHAAPVPAVGLVNEQTGYGQATGANSQANRPGEPQGDSAGTGAETGPALLAELASLPVDLRVHDGYRTVEVPQELFDRIIAALERFERTLD